VFAVHPALGVEGRLALADAAALAGATLERIVDTPTAVAATYALEKQKLFGTGKGQNVLFIDIGAAHSWASVCRLKKVHRSVNVEMLAVASTYSLGGRVMDLRIKELFIENFREKVDERQERLIENAAVRAKEALTLGEVTEMKLEELGEDGFAIPLEREQFVKMVSDVGQAIEKLFLEVVRKFDLKQLDAIELLGGTSRVPLVNTTLVRISKGKNLSRTMNSDEAIATGAGYLGIGSSMNLTVKPFAGMEVFLRAKGKLDKLYSRTGSVTGEVKRELKGADLKDLAIVVGGEESSEVLVFNISDVTEKSKVELFFKFNEFLVPDVVNATLKGKSLQIQKRWRTKMNETEFNASRMFVLDVKNDKRS
jgi:molecular chaperone DnaK (HSP70)